MALPVNEFENLLRFYRLTAMNIVFCGTLLHNMCTPKEDRNRKVCSATEIP